EGTHGASCLGPLSGLGDKKEMYRKAVQSLSDREKTTLMLVARPEESSLVEANRASQELRNIGVRNQMLIINGLFQSHMQDDKVFIAFYELQQYALNIMPEELKQLKTYSLPYVSYSLTGIDNLRKLISNNPFVETEEVSDTTEPIQLSKLNNLVDDFTARNTRVIFTMGKGGVGKTSIASAIAVGLTEKGKKVHLTTTDPAAHLDYIVKDNSKKENLTISNIEPEKEVEKYKQEVLEQAGKDQDEEGLAYLKEELESP